MTYNVEGSDVTFWKWCPQACCTFSIFFSSSSWNQFVGDLLCIVPLEPMQNSRATTFVYTFVALSGIAILSRQQEADWVAILSKKSLTHCLQLEPINISVLCLTNIWRSRCASILINRVIYNSCTRGLSFTNTLGTKLRHNFLSIFDQLLYKNKVKPAS